MCKEVVLFSEGPFWSFHYTVFRDVHQALIFMHHALSLKHYSKEHPAGAATKKYTTVGEDSGYNTLPPPSAVQTGRGGHTLALT